MKRNKPETHVSVNPHLVQYHRTWFAWTDCEVCDKQFRREKAFTWVDYFGLPLRKYICSDCASSISECNNLIDGIDQAEHERRLAWIKHNKPPPPPPPPMRRG